MDFRGIHTWFFHILSRADVQYNETTKWLKQRLAVEYIMDGFNPRIEKWEISLDAIKEALTNSICHRDYYDTAANIIVELYDDRLEISNPGGLLPIVARNFGHMSKSRNPKIFELFTRRDLVEKVGSGIPRMADLMQEAGLPAPEYQTEGFFTTVLYKNKNTIKDTGKKTGKKIPERILEIIKENPQITVSDIAEQCGLTYNGTYYHIEKMRKKGILTHKGGDKGGEWVIL